MTKKITFDEDDSQISSLLNDLIQDKQEPVVPEDNMSDSDEDETPEAYSTKDVNLKVLKQKEEEELEERKKQQALKSKRRKRQEKQAKKLAEIQIDEPLLLSEDVLASVKSQLEKESSADEEQEKPVQEKKMKKKKNTHIRTFDNIKVVSLNRLKKPTESEADMISKSIQLFKQRRLNRRSVRRTSALTSMGQKWSKVHHMPSPYFGMAK